jgi:hypothetical protein
MLLNEFKTFDELLDFENVSNVTLARSVGPSVRNPVKSSVKWSAKPKKKKTAIRFSKRRSAVKASVRG